MPVSDIKLKVSVEEWFPKVLGELGKVVDEKLSDKITTEEAIELVESFAVNTVKHAISVTSDLTYPVVDNSRIVTGTFNDYVVDPLKNGVGKRI